MIVVTGASNSSHDMDEGRIKAELIGYADKISVAPGETVEVKVSTDAEAYSAAIVRLIHGDCTPPGFKEEILTADERHPGRKQTAHPGSYGIVETGLLLRSLSSFTIQMWIYATTPKKRQAQGLLSQ